MARLIRRPKCISTKLSESEFSLLEAFASATNKTTSEWAREILLRYVRQEEEESTNASHVQLAELLALRGIVLNLFFLLLNGEHISKEQMQSIVDEIDGGKAVKAARLLSGRGANSS